MKRTLLFVQITFLALAVNAQLSREQTERYMTNGTLRNWQFKVYRKSLGGNECTGDGQLFTFNKEHLLQRKRCLNGKKDYKAVKWELIPITESNMSEWQVKLSEPLEIKDGDMIQSLRVYLPLPKTNTKGKEMRLQVVPDCKACLQQLIVLTSID